MLIALFTRFFFLFSCLYFPYKISGVVRPWMILPVAFVWGKYLIVSLEMFDLHVFIICNRIKVEYFRQWLKICNFIAIFMKFYFFIAGSICIASCCPCMKNIWNKFENQIDVDMQEMLAQFNTILIKIDNVLKTSKCCLATDYYTKLNYRLL